MVNYVESMPRKPLCGNGSSSIVILLYDKKFPIMSIIGSYKSVDRLLIFQYYCGYGGGGVFRYLTPLQLIGKNTPTVGQ